MQLYVDHGHEPTGEWKRVGVLESAVVAVEGAEGHAYQARTLDDGSVHRVLKNFPSEASLREAVAGIASNVQYHEWQYFWALEYVVP